MAQFTTTACPHCGQRVLKKGVVMLNVTHNPRGINHHLTCPKWPTQQTLLLPEPPDAA